MKRLRTGLQGPRRPRQHHEKPFHRILFEPLRLAMCLCLLAVAGSANDETSPIPLPAAQPRLGLLKPTTKLVDRKVGDVKGKTVGKMRDLLLDLSAARVLAAYLSVGAGHPLTPVPAQAFVNYSSSQLRLNATRKQFRGAPSGPALGADPLNTSLASFDNPPARGPAQGSGQLARVSELVGAPLRGETGEVLGRIRDVMVDLPVGAAVYLVIEPVGGAQPGADLYVVPPESVRRDHAGGAWVIAMDRARFLAGPHFESIYWSELALPEFEIAARKHYGLPLSAAPEPASLQCASVLGGLSRSGIPGAAPSDRETTQAVLEEIVNATRGWGKLNVGITTANGRVKLSGTVRNQDQRRRVLSAVERVVAPERIDDQIEARDGSRPDGAKSAT